MLLKRLAFGLSFAIVVSVSMLWAQPPRTRNIDTRILSDLRAKGEVAFFVVMKTRADASRATAIADRTNRGVFVADTLRDVADSSQRPVLARLAEVGEHAESFWVVNAIKVTTRDSGLVMELAARPDVAYLWVDEQIQIPRPQPGGTEPTIQGVEWGVARVRAPEVWERFGVRGESIVVANIDTGVQFDHPALVSQYRGRAEDGSFDHNYNWYDPSRVCPPGAPCDNNNHGTHTMGTMVGDDGGANQIGVAPRARWIAAKGCESSSCSSSALLASGQWVLAPTDLNGENPRPDLRPHIVNNSWGGSTSNPFFQEIVRNWVNAGIFPAFAVGNPGSACGGVVTPGAYPESFAVGATNSNDFIASFSGRGPALFFGGALKPNVSAPGVSVRSSIRNSSYASFSGTSMATPHAAGVVALLWAATPALNGDIARTIDILQSTAVSRPDSQCGAEGPPNNVYGWGIIDALAAVESTSSEGTLEGTVTNEVGEPIADAMVLAEGPASGSASTDSDGRYRMVLAPGSYTVSAGAFGYDSQTVEGVVITPRTATALDFALVASTVSESVARR